MRRHGWQLPYHPLQIVAVAVFFALVFAFYVFFIPFVGSKILEVVVIVLYSPTVVVVFALYVWCVAINPADEGLLISKKCNAPLCSESKPAPSMLSSRVDGKELELACEKGADRCSTLEEAGAEKWTKQKDARSCWAFAFFILIQSYLCKSETYLPSNQADMLYCSLCKVEISKDSKHCRVCDKCIDGFDHHCRWLNNCVGRKNYKDFVALMVSGIAMKLAVLSRLLISDVHFYLIRKLILQWSVGLWVLIHCFLSFSHCQSMIISKLGSSFSPVAYIIVVALCTLLAMAATYPLGQLFFFHMLLIKKGISTYDYIVAMREQDQKGVGDAAQSPLTSPVSSVGTVNSGGSSAGALQGRAWCTPPRFFLDHEQGVYPPERSFSVKGMSSGLPSGPEFDRRKPVKLSTWALASLNKDDVLRATTIAKKKSSILLPVASSNERTTVQDVNYRISSSRDASTELCPSLANRSASTRAAEVHLNLADQSAPVSFMERGKFPVMSFDGSGSDSGDVIQLSRKARKALNPLQMEAMNAFKTSHSFSNDGMTVSSPESIGAPSEPQHFPDNELDVFELPHYSVVPTDWQYNVQGIGSSPSDTDGGLSSSCTPIRQALYAAHEGSL